MLKNILDTINKYNENGTIIEKNNKFYWFNGKKYEFWCMKPRDASSNLLQTRIICFNVSSSISI